MKKKVLTLMILGTLLCSVTLFAQAALQYTVKEVSGKVEVETAAGKWEAVTVGMTLAPSAVINTGLNSKLVLENGDAVISIKPMKKGTVEKLIAEVSGTGSNIKLGAKVQSSGAAEDKGQVRSNVSTASTRASDATKDLEWAE